MGNQYDSWYENDTLYIRHIPVSIKPSTREEIDALIKKWEPVLRKLEDNDSTWFNEIRW